MNLKTKIKIYIFLENEQIKVKMNEMIVSENNK